MPMRRIALVVGRSVATVSRLLAGLGLSSLKALDPVQLVVRYEREAPGEPGELLKQQILPGLAQGRSVRNDARDGV
jgi:hypothetical protein